jgi:hypothetical protein
MLSVQVYYLSVQSRAVVLTVASLEMFVTYKAMHLQSHDTLMLCYADVA